MTPSPPSVLAPAKINLYLHVTGRRDDGYHTLDSLAVFANIGDRITLEPARNFDFRIDGPFARSFTAHEFDISKKSGNLVVRAVHALAGMTGKSPGFKITLTKNLPLASGLGGGSADAAAVIWAIMNYWDLPASLPGLDKTLLALGADVPACFRSAPVHMQGIGETLSPVQNLPEIPVVLINPLIQCPTKNVFLSFTGPFTSAPVYPDSFPEPSDLIGFISGQNNDLTQSAQTIVPEIAKIIEALNRQPACKIARMSGSGATVFGLFEDAESAMQATETLTIDRPRWWVRTGVINSPARY